VKKRLLIIFIAFGVSFGSMIGLSLFSIERLKTYIFYSDQMDHTNFILTQLYRTQIYLANIDKAERGYMITKDTVYLGHINRAIDSTYFSLSKLDTFIADSTVLQQDFNQLRKEVDIRVIAVKNNIRYVDSTHSVTPSTYFINSRAETRACNKMVKAMSLSETALLKQRFDDENFYKSLTAASIKYLLVVFCVVTLVLFLMLLKELIGRIRYQDELQNKLLELKRSHNELEEIAYVTSHDLQEPLRKIQVFSNMLTSQHNGRIEPEIRSHLERIQASAKSMQLMITELMNLSSLTRIDEHKKNIALNDLIRYVVAEFNDQIIEKNVVIAADDLPEIFGYENQLKLLFKELIENSIKFTRTGIQPLIEVKAALVAGSDVPDVVKSAQHKKYIKVTISDNGIGFDDQYVSKIFRIFQKLQPDDKELSGKGIGLAICRKIMTNHEGYIFGKSQLMNGAQFDLFFPVNSTN